MRKHATTTFTLDSWDEKNYDEKEGAPRLARVTSTKSYKGDIEGQSKLEYLMMYRSDGTATYVGLERLTGTIDGRSGSFILQHNGAFEAGAAKQSYPYFQAPAQEISAAFQAKVPSTSDTTHRTQ